MAPIIYRFIDLEGVDIGNNEYLSTNLLISNSRRHNFPLGNLEEYELALNNSGTIKIESETEIYYYMFSRLEISMTNFTIQFTNKNVIICHESKVAFHKKPKEIKLETALKELIPVPIKNVRKI